MGLPSPTTPPPAPTIRHPHLRALVAVCCWLYLAAVLGVWIVMAWTDRWWLATFLAFAPRWLLFLPLILLFPAALFLRRRSLLLLLVAAVLTAGPVMGLSVGWHKWFQSPPAGRTLRVLTCNMHYTHGDPGPLDALVAAVEPDLVAVQEWGSSARSVLNNTSGWHVHEGLRLFLASRHPIREVVELGEDSMCEQGSVTRYEVETPLGVVHLFSLHLATIRPGAAEKTYDRSHWRQDVIDNSKRRWEQSEFVAEQARGCGPRLLIVGDFNTPPQSALFSRVWGEYGDAFGEAGTGWGYTFFGARTMVRIDHVLTGKGWYCRSCEVGPEVGSPHRPVIADLVWPDAP